MKIEEEDTGDKIQEIVTESETKSVLTSSNANPDEPTIEDEDEVCFKVMMDLIQNYIGK